MLKPENWFLFAQQVRMERRLFRVPDYPDPGFLLKHRNVALKIMSRELRDSNAPADVNFLRTLDQIRYQQMKNLVLVLSDAKPEQLAKIEAATTLMEIQRVFIEIGDENTGRTAQQQVS
jgi:hypothetical protein